MSPAAWVFLALFVVAAVAGALTYAALVRRRVTHPYAASDVDAARKVSVKQSRATRDGAAAEVLTPWLPEFPYAARDARFLGSPIDFVVFDGLDDGNLRDIVFVEVKTGNPDLGRRGRQIRNALEQRRVRHEVLRLSKTGRSALEDDSDAGDSGLRGISVPPRSLTDK